ncbi:hypothetical protein B0H16DRAFT_1642882 [Mycena metata]|uniref:Uncharacterized protein n=1 Tax=Mycena metata TaxID=1033252 RepID=A0AAD7GQ04_9AGAR|nr:hypothetical protein B0H16DRAFT_1642882 [Mycena metata]
MLPPPIAYFSFPFIRALHPNAPIAFCAPPPHSRNLALQMQCTIDPVLFDENWQDLVFQIVTTCVEIFLYAIFIVLFIFATHGLARRNVARTRRILLTFSCVMALLGTAQIVVLLVTTAVQARLLRAQTVDTLGLAVLGLTTRVEILAKAHDIMFAINNFVSDLLLLYRCYVIWGCRWRIAVAPGILVASTLAIGLMTITGLYPNPKLQYLYIASTITNFTLTMLTAGRIWWIRRASQTLHGTASNTLRHCYDRAVEMILESGGIYCVFSIGLTITEPEGFDGSLLALVLVSIGTHLINIAPMLIVLRVGRTHGPNAGESREPEALIQQKRLRWPTQPLEPSSLEVLHIKPSEDEDPLARSEG